MAITFVGAGVASAAAFSANPFNPTGLAAGDRLLLIAGGKPYSSVPTIADTGWGLLSTATSGTVVNGVATGSTISAVFSREATPSMSGAATQVDMASGSPTMAQTLAFRSATANLPAVAVGLSDTDETGTSISATAASDPGFTTGDMVVIGITLKNSTITHSSQTVTIPGCTLGTITWLTQFTTISGNDGSHFTGYASITAGTSSGVATYTATSNTSGESAISGVIVRLRESSVAPNLQVGREQARVGLSTTGNAQVGREQASIGIQTVGSAVVGREQIRVGIENEPPGWRLTKTYTPTSVLSNTGGWTNPQNVYYSDDTFATNTGVVQNTEYPFEAGGFNFSTIPDDAWIESVTIFVEARSTSAANRQHVQLQAYDDATLLGTVPLQLISSTTSDTILTATATATMAQLKSANFKLVVTGKRVSSSAATLSVDQVGVIVTYVLSNGIPRVGLTVGLGTGTTTSVTVPPGIVAGDLLIAFIGGYGQVVSQNRWELSSLPSGFTLAGGTLASPTCFIGSIDAGDRTGYTVATKTADGTESGTTLTVTWVTSVTGLAQRVVALAIYRGVTLAEVVDSSNTANTASTAGSVTASGAAVGITIGAESTASASGAIDDAVPTVGDAWYVLRRPLNSPGLPSIAIGDFAVSSGASLPVADWTWTGGGNGPVGKRGTSTILLGLAVPTSIELAGEQLQALESPVPDIQIAGEQIQVLETGNPDIRLGGEQISALVPNLTPVDIHLAGEHIQALTENIVLPPAPPIIQIAGEHMQVLTQNIVIPPTPIGPCSEPVVRINPAKIWKSLM